MKITICGSIAFIDEMLAAQKELEAMGHEVKTPPTEIEGEDGVLMPVKEYYAIRKATMSTDGWIRERKEQAMRRHFDKVMWADAVLVLNHDKNGIAGYVGANTLMEMGLAFHHRKKIFLLHPIPDMDYQEEILGMSPVVLGGALERIT